jgi:hypothetical protein
MSKRFRLTYSNVIATLALFISLGGASYAAIVLPANSVGPRQLRSNAVGVRSLSFPLGTAGVTDAKVEDLTKNGCNGGGFTGRAAPDCSRVALSAAEPTPSREVHIRFKSPGHLLIYAALNLTNEGAPQSMARIKISLSVDRHRIAESEVTSAGGQASQAPIQALDTVSTGVHVAALEVSAEYNSSAPGDVLVSSSSVIASALPE